MRLTEEEEAMRAGCHGPALQWAIHHQIRVGNYLGAEDFVPVAQAHIMADTESLGPAGVEWLERLARLPARERRVRIPTLTDPRGTDFAAAHRLKQQPWMVDLERRAIAALEALGVLMTNTCINYQTIMPPVLGEHVAYGDTGVVIYCNSVCGARSNFEGGPSALAEEAIRDGFLQSGQEPVGGSAQAFSQLVHGDFETYARLMKELNIKVD